MLVTKKNLKIVIKHSQHVRHCSRARDRYQTLATSHCSRTSHPPGLSKSLASTLHPHGSGQLLDPGGRMLRLLESPPHPRLLRGSQSTQVPTPSANKLPRRLGSLLRNFPDLTAPAARIAASPRHTGPRPRPPLPSWPSWPRGLWVLLPPARQRHGRGEPSAAATSTRRTTRLRTASLKPPITASSSRWPDPPQPAPFTPDCRLASPEPASTR